MILPAGPQRISAHFTAAELACHHCDACCVELALLHLLERIRHAIGRPLPIVDGFRCPVHNKEVGGASESQHMYGRAADLPPGMVSTGAAASSGARGIGSRGDWAVHVDVRPGPPARWTY